MKAFRWLLAILVVLAFTAVPAMAEFDMHPQYNKKGSFGKNTKRWREFQMQDLVVHENFKTTQQEEKSDAGTSVFGTQISPKVVNVTSYTQLTNYGGGNGGTYVYVLDLTRGNEFRFDMQKIYESMTVGSAMTAYCISAVTGFGNANSGLTVIVRAPSAVTNWAIFDLVKWDSGATPITLWADHDSGVTPLCNLLATYHTGTSVWTASSSVSDAPLASQYDRTRYQNNYDSGTSITPVYQFIRASKTPI